jgi:uncharacterized protein YbjT (DUF2867 family)
MDAEKRFQAIEGKVQDLIERISRIELSLKSNRIVLVTGITGKQGHSVAQYLLQDGSFRVRGITRNLNSDRAKELQRQGVELFQANEKDDQSMRRAIKGCYAMFAVTNFWDPEIGMKEEEVGKRLATLAKEEGIQHYIWSSLVNVDRISRGKYKVPHFTLKSRVEEHIRNLQFAHHTFVAPAFYYQNFFSPYIPLREENNELVCSLPISGNTLLSAFDVDELGSIVLPILKKPEEWKDRFIPIVGDHIPLRDYLDILSVLKKQKVRLEKISREEYSAKTNEEMCEMLAYFEEFTYYGPQVKEIDLGKKLNPKLSSWRQWLETHQEQSAQSL